MREKVNMNYSTFEPDIVAGRRIFFCREATEWFADHKYENPDKVGSRFLAHLRQQRGWISRRTSSRTWVQIHPRATWEEVRKFCLANGIARLNETIEYPAFIASHAPAPAPVHKPKPERKGTKPPEPKTFECKGYVGWGELRDYVKRAAEVCGVVQSKYWYNLPEWEGPRYLRSIR